MPKSISFFLATSWTLFVTLLSLINVGSLGNSIKIPHKDKMVHFVFYFLFYVLWFVCLKAFNKADKNKVVLLIVAISYGILMELLQAIMGNHRTSDFYDVIANSFGATVGFVTVNRFLANKK